MSRAEWLDDDAIPHLDVYTGTEIFAEAFGCKVQRPADNMPFALPLVSKARQACPSFGLFSSRRRDSLLNAKPANAPAS